MPDLDGYLTENEVLVGGQVWEVEDCEGKGYACEEEACDRLAVYEVRTGDEEDFASACFCEAHFEAWKREGRA